MIIHKAKAIIKDLKTVEQMVNDINTLTGRDISYFTRSFSSYILIIGYKDYEVVKSCTNLYPNIPFKFTTDVY